jgi:hypothetical protein
MHHPILSIRSTPSRIGLVLTLAVVSILGTWLHSNAEESLPSSLPDFPSIVRAHSERLAMIESDKEANTLFVSAIGPALHMDDAVRTLKTNPLSAKLARELLAQDLSAAALRLMSNLAAWHLASTIRHAVSDQQLAIVTQQLSQPSQARAWLDQQKQAPWHDALNQLIAVIDSPEWVEGSRDGSTSALSITLLDRAGHMEAEALQASYREWDRIRSWKDRVRDFRGKTRLCGTWQWTIHNHQQHHQEQKLSLLFPPPGVPHSTLRELAEAIVLGDNVYLRWEFNGRTQEDSLQFSNEGRRLEGTFVNSEGGWGSVSGKRTADCMP